MNDDNAITTTLYDAQLIDWAVDLAQEGADHTAIAEVEQTPEKTTVISVREQWPFPESTGDVESSSAIDKCQDLMALMRLAENEETLNKIAQRIADIPGADLQQQLTDTFNTCVTALKQGGSNRTRDRGARA